MHSRGPRSQTRFVLVEHTVDTDCSRQDICLEIFTYLSTDVTYSLVATVPKVCSESSPPGDRRFVATVFFSLQSKGC